MTIALDSRRTECKIARKEDEAAGDRSGTTGADREKVSKSDREEDRLSLAASVRVASRKKHDMARARGGEEDDSTWRWIADDVPLRIFEGD